MIFTENDIPELRRFLYEKDLVPRYPNLREIHEYIINVTNVSNMLNIKKRFFLYNFFYFC